MTKNSLTEKACVNNNKNKNGYLRSEDAFSMNVIEYSLLDFYMKVQQDNCTQFRTIHYLLWNDPLFVMHVPIIHYSLFYHNGRLQRHSRSL